MITRRMRFYLAAPLFNDGERARNRYIRDSIEDQVDVFLPQEDGALLVDLVKNGMSIESAKKYIFEKDIEAIRRSDGVIVIMDGRSVDEGACFELGVAFALNKRCVGLKTDPRTLLPHGDNPMIEMALERLFRSDNALFDWIKQISSEAKVGTDDVL